MKYFENFCHFGIYRTVAPHNILLICYVVQWYLCYLALSTGVIAHTYNYMYGNIRARDNVFNKILYISSSMCVTVGE